MSDQIKALNKTNLFKTGYTNERKISTDVIPIKPTNLNVNQFKYEISIFLILQSLIGQILHLNRQSV